MILANCIQAQHLHFGNNGFILSVVGCLVGCLVGCFIKVILAARDSRDEFFFSIFIFYYYL
jgi:ABC-type lipoprotein release transport system permease subunit